MITDEQKKFYDQQPFLVLIFDQQGSLQFSNKAAVVLIANWSEKSTITLPPEFKNTLHKAVQSRRQIQHDFLLKNVFYIFNFQPHQNKMVICYGNELSLDRMRKAQMACLEQIDPLTDLPNREQFLEYLTDTIVSASKQNHPFAVLTLEIDKLSSINSNYGHQIGDVILYQCASRLIECMPNGTYIARIAGASFAMCCLNLKEVSMVEHSTQVLLDNFLMPFHAVGKEFLLSMRVGISVFPNDAEKAKALLYYSQLAKDRVKSQHHFEFYRQYMSSAAKAKRDLMDDFERAIDAGQLRLFLQPQYTVYDRLIKGAESLVRWQHPKLGLLTPQRFTHLMSQSQYLESVTEWVLTKTCVELQRYKKLGIKKMTLAVNLPVEHLRNSSIVETVRKLSQAHQIDPCCLELEITESSQIEDMYQAKAVMVGLNDLGVQLVVDDFGTGYSSLSYLQQLPIRKLKIDRSFVQGIGIDADDIIRATIDMGHQMEIEVIAEGVETQAQYDFLLDAGCDQVQGYYFSKPMPRDEFWQLLEQN